MLDDRKKCLNENSHQAKDSDVSIKCSECSSDRHLAAFHPGPPLQPSEPASSRDGGEEEDSPQPEVTSTCMEIC